jgi:hypothetical protein
METAQAGKTMLAIGRLHTFDLGVVAAFNGTAIMRLVDAGAFGEGTPEAPAPH